MSIIILKFYIDLNLIVQRHGDNEKVQFSFKSIKVIEI